MGFDWNNFIPYESSNLQAFNGTTTLPLGYIEVMVSLGNGRDIWTVNAQFLINPRRSFYSCILGRAFLTMLDIVASLVHLKLNYYNMQGESGTIDIDLEGEKRIYQALKNDHREAIAIELNSISLTSQINRMCIHPPKVAEKAIRSEQIGSGHSSYVSYYSIIMKALLQSFLICMLVLLSTSK